MFSALHELTMAVVEGRPAALFVWAILYFWIVWGVKVALLVLYRPSRDDFRIPISVVMPCYNEDRSVLRKAIDLVRAQPSDLVAEIVVVIDSREKGIRGWMEENFAGEDRIRIEETFLPGKRRSLALGIRAATRDVVVSVESDVFVGPDSLSEIVRPFADPKVGGVVGDQRIYKASDRALYWVNAIAESVKYQLSYPAFSVFGAVTVLSGRCVAYRREAVLPLLDGLTEERFLGRPCFSGDDGRMTSLLLEAGWKTLYQGTSIIETVSPPTWRDLIKQQTRWFRNTGRRTSRALLADGFWAWRRPAILFQMITAWTNPLVLGAMLWGLAMSIVSRSWFWFGTDAAGVALRVGLILCGVLVTRFVRSWFGLRVFPRSKWLWVVLIPWYGLVLWAVKIWAFFTMNRQGWVTRTAGSGPGGFLGSPSFRIAPPLEPVAAAPGVAAVVASSGLETSG